MSVTLIVLYLCVQKCCVDAWSRVIHLYTLLFVSTRSCFYNKNNQMHQCIKFILFWTDTVHVSDDLSVHHQGFKTVHTGTKQILLSAC